MERLNKKNNNEEAFNEIYELVQSIQKTNSIQIENLTEEVNRIIKDKCKEEKTISYIFDSFLSLTFVSKEEIEPIYYKLISYTKKIDKELANDYENFFVEYFVKASDDDLEI